VITRQKPSNSCEKNFFGSFDLDRGFKCYKPTVKFTPHIHKHLCGQQKAEIAFPERSPCCNFCKVITANARAPTEFRPVRPSIRPDDKARFSASANFDPSLDDLIFYRYRRRSPDRRLVRVVVLAHHSNKFSLPHPRQSQSRCGRISTRFSKKRARHGRGAEKRDLRRYYFSTSCIILL
jgi:hypothetical protein